MTAAPQLEFGPVDRAPADDSAGRLAWQAWMVGRPVQAAGVSCWPRRSEAVAGLAWATPASGARCLALAAYVRALSDPELHELLRALPCAVFDGLLEAAYAEGTAA